MLVWLEEKIVSRLAFLGGNGVILLIMGYLQKIYFLLYFHY